MPWATTAVVAFLPGYLFFSGVYNNDTLATAWVTLALALSIGLVQGHAAPRDLLALGAVLGLGLLTKLTTLPALAFAGLGLLFHLWRTRERGSLTSRLIRGSTLLGLPILALSGWWVARNIRLYGLTDPLGTKAWSESIGHQLRTVPLSTEIGTYLWVQFTTFWGRFGWGSIPLPKPLYLALLAICALAVGGLAVMALRRRDALSQDQRWSLGLSAIAAGLLYVAVFRLALQFNLIVAHGRYLYPALPALALLFASGLLAPWPRPARRLLATALAAAMLALGLWSWRAVLVDAFTPPPSASAAEVEGADYPLDVTFDERLRLRGLSLEGAPRGWEALAAHRTRLPDGSTRTTVEPGVVADLAEDTDTAWPYVDVPHLGPGQTITVTLYWQSMADFWAEGIKQVGTSTVARDDAAFAHLLDANGEVIARVDQIPFDGIWPTMAWPLGDTYAQHLPLTLPADTPLGQASLLVGLYEDGHPDERFRADGPGGDWAHVIEEAVTIGPWLVLGAEEAERSSGGAHMNFHEEGGSGAVRLVESAVEQAEEAIDVTLTWRADRPPPQDTRVFVHLLGPWSEEGIPSLVPIAQSDGIPAAGRLPLHLWPPAIAIEDEHHLRLPPDLIPGTYQLHVGLYSSADGARWESVEQLPIAILDLR